MALNTMNVEQLAILMHEKEVKAEVIEVFEAAEIDGQLFISMTRAEIYDMFKTLALKRAAFSAWEAITGLSDTDRPGGNEVAVGNERKRTRTVIESDDEEEVLDSQSINSDTNKRPREDQNEDEGSEFQCSTPNTPSTLDTSKSSSCSSSSFTDAGGNSSPQGDWLKNYSLPKRFSYAVEAGLKSNFLPPNLINELIRDVCTSVQNHTRSPNKYEREEVAKKICGEYPFLKAPQLSKDTKPWGSLEVKIMNRFKKLQRRKSRHDTERVKTPSPPKKSWLAVPNVPNLNEVEEAVISIQQEWKKSRKDHGVIKSLMGITYGRRREMILSEERPLTEILKAFPPLSNTLYIKSDFGRILGKEDVAKQIKSNLSEVWKERVLAYAKTLPKLQGVLDEMESAVDSGCNEEECKERATLQLASLMLRPPNKKGQNNEHEEAVIKVLQTEGQQSFDQQLKKIIQPCIVVSDNLYNGDLMYVVSEGTQMCNITTKKIGDALVVLLATYFLYNMSYTTGKNVYKFLELTMMGLNYEKNPVSVETTIGVLSNFDKK